MNGSLSYLVIGSGSRDLSLSSARLNRSSEVWMATRRRAGDCMAKAWGVAEPLCAALLE